MSKSREGCIVGGILLLMLDAYGVTEGRLPLRGGKGISLAEYPDLFWPYAIGLGVIGAAAIVWGLTRPQDSGL